MTSRLVLAMPAYNEERALPALLEAAARDLAGLPYEVVVVDDGSTDRTAEVVREHAAKLPVTLVPHPKNLGLAAGIRTCLAEGARRAGDDGWVVTMDADNTHPPAQIKSMPLDGSCDLCVVSRYAPGAKIDGVGPGRKALSEVASFVLRTLFPVPGVRDYSSGYRAYRGALLNRALARHGERLIESEGFAVQVEVLLKLAPLGMRGTEIPIDLQYGRKPTPSKARMLHTAVDLARVMRRALFSRTSAP